MIKHDLILTIVNRGFADEVMSAAKAAGAFGGTVVNARGTAFFRCDYSTRKRACDDFDRTRKKKFNNGSDLPRCGIVKRGNGNLLFPAC